MKNKYIDNSISTASPEGGQTGGVLSEGPRFIRHFAGNKSAGPGARGRGCGVTAWGRARSLRADGTSRRNDDGHAVHAGANSCYARHVSTHRASPHPPGVAFRRVLRDNTVETAPLPCFRAREDASFRHPRAASWHVQGGKRAGRLEPPLISRGVEPRAGTPRPE